MTSLPTHILANEDIIKSSYGLCHARTHTIKNNKSLFGRCNKYHLCHYGLCKYHSNEMYNMGIPKYGDIRIHGYLPSNTNDEYINIPSVSYDKGIMIWNKIPEILDYRNPEMQIVYPMKHIISKNGTVKLL